jgi:hypothetical protein
MRRYAFALVAGALTLAGVVFAFSAIVVAVYVGIMESCH